MSSHIVPFPLDQDKIDRLQCIEEIGYVDYSHIVRKKLNANIEAKFGQAISHYFGLDCDD